MRLYRSNLPDLRYVFYIRDQSQPRHLASQSSQSNAPSSESHARRLVFDAPIFYHLMYRPFYINRHDRCKYPLCLSVGCPVYESRETLKRTRMLATCLIRTSVDNVCENESALSVHQSLNVFVAGGWDLKIAFLLPSLRNIWGSVFHLMLVIGTTWFCFGFLYYFEKKKWIWIKFKWLIK